MSDTRSQQASSGLAAALAVQASGALARPGSAFSASVNFAGFPVELFELGGRAILVTDIHACRL